MISSRRQLYDSALNLGVVENQQLQPNLELQLAQPGDIYNPHPNYSDVGQIQVDSYNQFQTNFFVSKNTPSHSDLLLRTRDSHIQLQHGFVNTTAPSHNDLLRNTRDSYIQFQTNDLVYRTAPSLGDLLGNKRGSHIQFETNEFVEITAPSHSDLLRRSPHSQILSQHGCVDKTASTHTDLLHGLGGLHIHSQTDDELVDTTDVLYEDLLHDLGDLHIESQTDGPFVDSYAPLYNDLGQDPGDSIHSQTDGIANTTEAFGHGQEFSYTYDGN